jgi:predicted metal-binding membrane protein
MHEMPMSGGWALSMVWMRVPGQTWPGAAASFLGMWMVMMVPMMLPSLVPVLWRYRRAVGGAGASHSASLTMLVGIGYFLVWTVLGAAIYPLGVTLAAIAMWQPALARLAPIAAAVSALIAGALQLTAWKAHHLACWREVPISSPARSTAGGAWRHGLRLGVHCGYSCSAPMAILLIVGVMDFRAMAIVTAVITAERLAPSGERVARAGGIVAFGTGLFLIARAVVLG